MRTPLVRTKVAPAFSVADTESPIATGFCVGLSAELGRVRAGDLGRSETAVSTDRSNRARTRYALGQPAQIGLACAAERVTVSGLDSRLALVERPPRNDEDPEARDIARTFPQRSGQALEMTTNRIERRRGVLSELPVRALG